MRRRFHLFFEQSGTFKNELKKMRYEAKDYDILDDFGETDIVIDLFSEIEKAFRGGQSVFDEIKSSDMIIAFFPCVRFEDQCILNVTGNNCGMKKWNEEKKLEHSIQFVEELNNMYRLVSELAIVCIRRKIPLIIENPYSVQHYLTRYWCLKPKVIDMDRRKEGDYYQKPTQFFFIGCEPKNNFIFEALDYVEPRTVKGECNQVNRSLIHPQYANRFLRRYVLDL